MGRKRAVRSGRYRFPALLHAFFGMRRNPDEITSLKELAKVVNVSERAMNTWSRGDNAPGNPEVILKLAKALELTPDHADLLLYSVNPRWVHFGTPAAKLEAMDLIGVREYAVSYPVPETVRPPALAEIERSWRVIMRDQFESNTNRWGLGCKDDGMGQIERSMDNGQLLLTLRNRYYNLLFLGADSNCFAPQVYYLSVEARIVSGNTENAGYVVIFDELSDNIHAIFRIREHEGAASVVQTIEGKHEFTVYLDRVPMPAIRPREWNKLAILAIHTHHWFYINDILVQGGVTIPRHPVARLDLGMVSEHQEPITAAFRNFTLRVPPLGDGVETGG